MDPAVAYHCYLHQLPTAFSPDQDRHSSPSTSLEASIRAYLHNTQCAESTTSPATLGSARTIRRPPSKPRLYDIPASKPSRTRRELEPKTMPPPRGMRTFWRDDNDEPRDSASMSNNPTSSKPIDCTLDIRPRRTTSPCPTISPATDSPAWSFEDTDLSSHEKGDEIDFTALMTCHHRFQDAIDEEHEDPSSHAQYSQDMKSSEQPPRLFRSQELLEGRLQANDAELGKLDWTSAWMAV